MSLGLFIHNHQPVGDYDAVFERNWDLAYRPMLEALEHHPAVRLTLHYSGPLIDWLDAHHPEFESMLGRLIERDQVELAGGGYYEPILAMLPEAGRIGQVAFMAEELERRWGVRPSGAWLAERVWEPGLVNPLVRAGVRYTMLDDAHFTPLGLTGDDLDGYHLTEDGGQPLALFAGVQDLRTRIPWVDPAQTITWLRMRTRAQGPRLFVMGDDGEKFGAWPNTTELCWTEDRWVERFFAALEESTDWLTTVRLGDWLATERPRGVAYVPAGSYHEMDEWALPASEQQSRRKRHEAIRTAGLDPPPAQPGFWRHFLVRYPEAGAMRQRALRVRALIDLMEPSVERTQAERALWAGECNTPYWHGVSGGVYLRHIRVASTAALVRAERLARADEPPPPEPESRDIDLDGYPELILRTRSQQLVIDHAKGGAIVQWDLLDHDWPLLTVIARRPEAYHEVSRAAEAGITIPRYDNRLRLAAQEQVLRVGAGETGWLYRDSEVAAPYNGPWDTMPVGASDGSRGIALRREEFGLWIRKTITLPADGPGLTIVYAIENPGRYPIEAVFVSEWNLGLPGHDGSAGWEQVRPPYDTGPTLLDAGGAFALTFATEGFDDTWHQRIETLSASHEGLELTYQGLSLAFAKRIRVLPSEPVTARVRWDVVTGR